MDFLIIAYDGTDAGAPQRRQKAREGHLQRAQRMREEGHLVEGGAILNEQGGMIGSTLYMRFDDRQALQDYIDNDPYVTGQVWEKIEVKPIKLVKFNE